MPRGVGKEGRRLGFLEVAEEKREREMAVVVLVEGGNGDLVLFLFDWFQWSVMKMLGRVLWVELQDANVAEFIFGPCF